MRIVVLRALYLGDFLTGVPALRAVRRAFPAARITLAAPRVLEPLVALTGGAVDDVCDTHELNPLPPHVHGADIGIDLHGCGPRSHRVLLDARVRRLIAFAHPEVPASAGGAPYRADEHETARWCRMLSSAGIPADPAELDLDVPALEPPPGLQDATLLHPGAASESRRWPVDNWIAVARAERRAGRRVILTGSAAEAERVRIIADAADISSSDRYAGRTSLLELAALVAAAGRIVCGDTGIAHLASAYRRPSVVLFGPTSPAHWGPPARPYHRVLWRGRLGDPHAATVDPGLAAIAPADVSAALAAVTPRARMSRATA